MKLIHVGYAYLRSRYSCFHANASITFYANESFSFSKRKKIQLNWKCKKQQNVHK